MPSSPPKLNGTDPRVHAGAKLTGLNLRESAAVGVLMNTRGLVELIVLNIGLEAKVITPKLFTILVMMVRRGVELCNVGPGRR